MSKEPTKDDEMIWDVQAASKVQTTLATTGWLEVIRPNLDKLRQYYDTKLHQRFESMDELAFVQQSVLAIDELFMFIEHTLAEGKNADEYFRNKGKE